MYVYDEYLYYTCNNIKEKKQYNSITFNFFYRMYSITLNRLPHNVHSKHRCLDMAGTPADDVINDAGC